MKNALLLAAIVSSALACGSSTDDDLSKALGTVTKAYRVSDGVCQAVTFDVPVPESSLDPLAEGTCPTTTKVGSYTATIVKVCDSFKDSGATYVVTIFNKGIDNSGNVYDVTEELASAQCDAYKQAVTASGK